jgi:AsmA protein
MGRVLRVVGIVVGLLIAVIITLSLALPLFINPNDYKDKITSLVKEETGRTLTIDGNIGLSVFPWLGLEVNKVKLSNAPGFGTQPMARVGEVDIRVKLLPLVLHRKVEMSTVTLDGLQLDLARNRQGQTNWQDLIKPAPAAKTPATPQQAAPATGGPPIAGLAIGGVKVRNAKLVWNDAQAGTHYAVQDLSLTTGAIEPGKPFDLAFKAHFQGGKPVVNGDISLSGKLWTSQSLEQAKVQDLHLAVQAKGGSLPPDGLKADLTTQAAIDLAKQTLDVPKLTLQAAGLTVHGDLKGTAISGPKARFTGTLKTDEFVPREVMANLGQTVPKTADPSVLAKAQASANLQASRTEAKIGDLKLRLDDSTVTGALGVRNFKAPAISFALNLDKIDLDRYLPPATKGSKGEAAKAAAVATPATGVAAGATALPVKELRKLNLEGTVNIGQLTAYKLHSSDIQLQVSAHDGLVRLSPAKAKLYNGAYNGDVSVDVRGAQPRISLNERLSGVQAGPLLKDLMGKELVTGTANADAKITGTGQDPAAIQKTLNGTAGFSFKNGALKGVNIAGLIRTARARLKGEAVPATGPEQTDFTELSGTAKITNGVLHNDDLSLQSPLLRVAGKGTADLPKQTIDYLLTTKIVGSLTGQGGKDLEQLKGIAIPIRITGTFNQPKFRPDLELALKEAAKGKVEQKVKEKRQELEKKLQNDLQNKLKGLFR